MKTRKRRRRTKNISTLDMLVELVLGIIFLPFVILTGLASVAAVLVSVGLALLIILGIAALILPILALIL